MNTLERTPQSFAEQPVRIWLVEDNLDYSAEVEAAINQEADLCCDGAYTCCEDALLALSMSAAPALMLLDIGLPGMTGLEGIQRIRISAPQMQVVLLTSFDDTQRIFSALRAGASGYLLKSCTQEGIIAAVREVLAGGAPMSPSVAQSVLRFFQSMPPTGPDYGLTPRELSVLDMMIKGLLKKQVASELQISFHTVDTHLRSIYAKLHVNSRSSAVAKAVGERLIR